MLSQLPCADVTVQMAQINRLGVGDAVGICTNEEGELVVEYNSQEVKQATVRPTYGAAVTQHLAPPPPGKAESFSTGRQLHSLVALHLRRDCLNKQPCIDMPTLLCRLCDFKLVLLCLSVSFSLCLLYTGLGACFCIPLHLLRLLTIAGGYCNMQSMF